MNLAIHSIIRTPSEREAIRKEFAIPDCICGETAVKRCECGAGMCRRCQYENGCSACEDNARYEQHIAEMGGRPDWGCR